MGDGRQFRADEKPAKDDSSQAFLDALRQRSAEQPGVAPGFSNQPGPGRDRYYKPPAEGERRPHYGPSGTLFPGANGTDQTQQPAVPNFREAHKDKVVDPNKPWERFDPGIAGTHPNGTNKGASGRTSFAWNGGDFFDPRVDATIMRRGQHVDLTSAALFAAGAGIASPMLHTGITKLADRAVERNPDSRLGKAWQEHFDPTKAGTADLIKGGDKYKSAFENFETLKTNLREMAQGESPEAKLAKEKLEFLESRVNSGKFTATHVSEAQFIPGLNGAKAFTESEIGTLAARANAGSALDAAQAKSTSRYAAIAEKVPFVARAVDGIAGTLGVFGAVSVDRWLTNKEGGVKALHDSYNLSQFAAPVAIAALPTFKYKALGAAGAVAASQVVDNIARSTGLTAHDRWNAASGVFDGWNGAFTASSLALAGYAKNPWAKGAIAAIGTLGPVAVHAYQDNIGGNIKGRTDAVRESLQADHQDRSQSSLERVSDRMSSLMGHVDPVTRVLGPVLGIGKDAATRGQSDWVVANADASFAALNANWKKMNMEQQLFALRDDAGAAGAIGNTTLENGTRVSDKTSTARYVVGGYDIDLGGRALHYLIRSRNSAEKAAQMTQVIIDNNNDPSQKVIKINGDTPKAQEVTDLANFAGKTNDKIDKLINGKHDVQGAFDELVKQSQVLDKDYIKTFIRQTDAVIGLYNQRMQKAQQDMNAAATAGDENARAAAQQRAEENAKVMAKVYRDQAMVYMAIAKAKMDNGNDGGGAFDLLIDDGRNHDPNKSYNGAQGALRMAEALSPNNPDMDQLGRIFSEQAKRMVDKKQAQLNSSTTNMLGYHDGYSRVGQ